MEQKLIEEIQSLAQSYHKYSKEEFNLKAKEALLRVYSMITSMELSVADKDDLIKKHSEERKSLIHKLNKAIESDRKTHERLADLDISRHIEVADLRHELEILRAEKEQSLKGDISEKLKKDLEVKKLQLKESEDNLHALAVSLQELNKSYKHMEDAYQALQNEANTMRETLKSASASSKEEKEAFAESDDSRRELHIYIAQLEQTIQDKTRENTSLRDVLSHMNSLMEEKEQELRQKYEREIERLNSALSPAKEEADRIAYERDGLSLKLRDADRETDLLKEENERLLKRLSEIERERQEPDAESSDEIKRLNEIVLLKETEAMKLKGQAEALELEKAKAEGNLSEALADIERLRQDNDRQASFYQDELEHLRKQMDELKADMADRELTLQARTKKLEALNDEIEALNTRHRDEAEALKGQYAQEAEVLKAQHIDELQALEGQHKAKTEGLASDVEKLRAEKERLSLKLKEAEIEAGLLKEEKSALSDMLSQVKNEMQMLKAERHEDTASLKAGLDEASLKIEDMLGRLENTVSANRALTEKLEQISDKTMAQLYPLLLEKQKESKIRVPKKGRGNSLKKMAVAVAVLIIIAGAGILGIYAARWSMRGAMPEGTAFTEKGAVPPVAIKKPEGTAFTQKGSQTPFKMPWSGIREVSHENFKAAVTFLSPDLLESYGVSSKVSDIEKNENYFYSLELKAEKDCIPEDIINSPLKKISFINQDGSLLKIKELPGLEAGKKAIYKVNACKGNTGAVHFRYFMALSNTHNPAGIIIEGLIKGPPLIIK